MYEDEKQRFKNKQGYKLDLDNPKSFNEKVVYKKLFDRNPLLVETADKYRVRDYIREQIGWEAESHLIPLLWVGKNPNKIPWDKLDSSCDYIIKSNNGAGRWLLVERKCSPPIKAFSEGKKKPVFNMPIKRRLEIIKMWFETIHGKEWYEWCYTQIDPLIVIEKVLHENGDLPLDYKCCMFNGECKMIYVLDKNDVHMTFYDGEFNPLDVKREGHPKSSILPKPKNFDKMMEFAHKLSKPFDFVRVDFYLVNDYIYFGELTHYPGSGHGKFIPQEYDWELGSYWKLGDYCNE